jgi:hypothetical protein
MNHINSKVLLGLGAAAGVAVIAAALVASHRQPVAEPAPAAGYALPQLREHINEVSGLALTVAEDKPAVTLVRGVQGWTVKEKGGYPADTGKLREILLKLADASLLQPKTQSEPRYPELGVEDLKAKDAKGVLVSLEGLPQPGRLIVGNPSAQGQATFVRAPGDKQSWLAKGSFGLDRDPARWLDTALTDIPASRVAEITLTQPGGKPVRLYKDQPGDAAYQASGLPSGQQPAAAVVNGLASALAGLKLADVASATVVQPPAEDQRLKARYRTFDGLTVEIQAWKRDGKPEATLAASLDQAAAEARIAVEQAQAKADDEAKRKAEPKDQAKATEPAPLAVSDPAKDREQRLAALNQEAEALNQRFRGWSFALPTNKYSSLDKSPADLAQAAAPKKEEAKAPAKPAAGKH